MESTTLVALQPADMPAAQQDLADWCQQKMRSLGQEYREYLASHTIAKRNRWGSRVALERAVLRTKKRIQYYQKIRDASRAGYVLIPNFNVDVVAVRVDNAKPRWKQETFDSYEVTHTPALLPPVGEGHFVSGRADVDHRSWETPNTHRPGEMITKHAYVRSGYIDDVDLPLDALKPQVLASLERALREKIFDRIGIVQHRKRSDPILVGQIIDPKENHPLNPKCVSFFLAWWLDLNTL